MIVPDAQSVLLAERHTYDFLYNIIFESSITNGWYLGGTLATRLLATSPKTVLENADLSDFSIELYGAGGRNSKIFAQMRALTDQLRHALQSQTTPHFIMLRSDASSNQYSIMLDGSRLLVTLYELSQQFMEMITHGTKLHKILNINILPQKAQLVDIYRDLYQPRPELWKTQLPRVAILTTKYEGGAEGEVDRQRQLILQKFVKNNKNVILIGDHAVRMITNQPLRSRIIHLLAIGPQNLAQDIAEEIDGEVFTTKEPIMRDMRLQRTSVRSTVDVVHIYHNLEYDVIGYTPLNDYRIGTKAVLLRFILIDYWLLVGKFVAGRLPEQFFKNKKKEILENLNYGKAFSLDDMAEPEHFMGQYFSDAAYAKAIRRETRFLPPYYGA